MSEAKKRMIYSDVEYSQEMYKHFGEGSDTYGKMLEQKDTLLFSVNKSINELVGDKHLLVLGRENGITKDWSVEDSFREALNGLYYGSTDTITIWDENGRLFVEAATSYGISSSEIMVMTDEGYEFYKKMGGIDGEIEPDSYSVYDFLGAEGRYVDIPRYAEKVLGAPAEEWVEGESLLSTVYTKEDIASFKEKSSSISNEDRDEELYPDWLPGGMTEEEFGEVADAMYRELYEKDEPIGQEEYTQAREVAKAIEGTPEPTRDDILSVAEQMRENPEVLREKIWGMVDFGDTAFITEGTMDFAKGEGEKVKPSNEGRQSLADVASGARQASGDLAQDAGRSAPSPER